MWSTRERQLQLLILVTALLIVAIIVTGGMIYTDFSDVEYWKRLGYPGVFILTMLSSASVVLPLPGVLATCGASTFQLNLLTIAILSGFGETIGELSGYGLGYGGKGIVENRRFYQKSKKWMQRKGVWALLVVSIIPNPIFDIVGIAAGATHFPLTKFLLSVGIGKTLKSLVIAYTCWWGLNSLPWITG